jgi:integral membrane sensor domain MASE1
VISELQRDVPGQDPTWGALVRRLGGNAVIGAAFALLYAVLVWLGHELNDVAVRMAILWPAAGLLLALLWLAPLRVWPLFIALQVGVEFRC